MKGKALWYLSCGCAELRDEDIGPPRAGEVLVRALFGAISRGTERLVLSGRVPVSQYDRMRAPHMAGDFPFPVKYGYAVVGRVEAGADAWRDRIVFCLHPHQSLFAVPEDAAVLVPDAIPPHRAVLAANMETALNAVWDGCAGPADRIAVVGGGLIGLLTAYLCARLPGVEVTLVDTASVRVGLARALGLRFASPDDAPVDCDLVFHASGTAAGLGAALRLAGEEASIIELSWYGTGDIAVPLGEAFHSRRLRLLSSQVGKVAPSRRPRWTHARRLAAALALLRDPALESLLSPAIGFHELPDQLPSLLDVHSERVCPLIRYPEAQIG